MVTQRPLEALFMVRIHVGQPLNHLWLFLKLYFAGIVFAQVSRRIDSLIGPKTTFQPDHEDADVGGRNPGNAGRLTNGRRTNLRKLLSRFESEAGNSRKIKGLRN